MRAIALIVGLLVLAPVAEACRYSPTDGFEHVLWADEGRFLVNKGWQVGWYEPESERFDAIDTLTRHGRAVMRPDGTAVALDAAHERDCPDFWPRVVRVHDLHADARFELENVTIAAATQAHLLVWDGPPEARELVLIDWEIGEETRRVTAMSLFAHLPDWERELAARAGISRLALSADGAHLLARVGTGLLAMSFDEQGEVHAARWIALRHEDLVMDMRFSPDGSRAAALSTQGLRFSELVIVEFGVNGPYVGHSERYGTGASALAWSVFGLAVVHGYDGYEGRAVVLRHHVDPGRGSVHEEVLPHMRAGGSAVWSLDRPELHVGVRLMAPSLVHWSPYGSDDVLEEPSEAPEPRLVAAPSAWLALMLMAWMRGGRFSTPTGCPEGSAGTRRA